MSNTEGDIRMAVAELGLYADMLAEEVRRGVDQDTIKLQRLALRAKFLMLRVLEWDEGNCPTETFTEANEAYSNFLYEIQSKR